LALQGIPLLYKNVVLSTQNIELFCRPSELKNNASFVRSLTVALPVGNDYDDAPSDAAQRRITMLSAALSGLHNLSAFSLSILNEGDARYLDMGASALVSLVDALPESCVSLEIHASRTTMPRKGEPQLCDSIRRILPRMEHVQLYMGYMCSALFGEEPLLPLPPNSSLGGRFAPVSLPNIQTLAIHCYHAKFHGTTCGVVHRDGPGEHKVLQRPGSGLRSITAALELLIGRTGSYPPSAKIFVSDSECALTDRPAYDTLFYSEMISKITWAFPLASGWGLSLLRVEDGQDEIFPEDLPFFNDKTWKTLVGGAREPAALLASNSPIVPAKRIVQSPGISSSEECRAENQNVRFHIW
jgi:hypothetical protein